MSTDNDSSPDDQPLNGFQFIENLSTAYWQSEVLFTALEADLFTKINQDKTSVKDLAACLGCNSEDLLRFMEVLESFNLIKNLNGKYHNTDAASTYLVAGKPSCMKEFFLYRRYMQPRWMKLPERICLEQSRHSLSNEDDYSTRTLHYVRAMDSLVKAKSASIIKITSEICSWELPVLDIGGGAGSLGRAFINSSDNNKIQSVLFDLPEVIEAARTIYSDTEDWAGIEPIGGDFRTHEFNNLFNLIILSNFLHVYSPEEARQLIVKAVELVSESGTIIVHDYFPDRRVNSPHKGVLYDINMMMNTYNGQCHKASAIYKWLVDSGMRTITIRDLNSDTSVIVAEKQKS